MANMSCSNVELDNKRLVLSALETKNGDPFSMPLSDAAVTLFQSCVGGKASTDLVFPLAGEKPMTSWKSLLNSVRKASDILVLSRLRSGLSTHLCGLSFKCQGAFST